MDLGCPPLKAFLKVELPEIFPGILTGFIMAFTLSLDDLSLIHILLIGDVIEGQYVANNLHFAAAIAFILMILLLVCMAVMRKLASRHVEGGL